jgi:hypothetical protein
MEKYKTLMSKLSLSTKTTNHRKINGKGKDMGIKMGIKEKKNPEERAKKNPINIL